MISTIQTTWNKKQNQLLLILGEKIKKIKIKFCLLNCVHVLTNLQSLHSIKNICIIFIIIIHLQRTKTVNVVAKTLL